MLAPVIDFVQYKQHKIFKKNMLKEKRRRTEGEMLYQWIRQCMLWYFMDNDTKHKINSRRQERYFKSLLRYLKVKTPGYDYAAKRRNKYYQKYYFPELHMTEVEIFYNEHPECKGIFPDEDLIGYDLKELRKLFKIKEEWEDSAG